MLKISDTNAGLAMSAFGRYVGKSGSNPDNPCRSLASV